MPSPTRIQTLKTFLAEHTARRDDAAEARDELRAEITRVVEALKDEPTDYQRWACRREGITEDERLAVLEWRDPLVVAPVTASGLRAELSEAAE